MNPFALSIKTALTCKQRGKAATSDLHTRVQMPQHQTCRLTGVGAAHKLKAGGRHQHDPPLLCGHLAAAQLQQATFGYRQWCRYESTCCGMHRRQAAEHSHRRHGGASTGQSANHTRPQPERAMFCARSEFWHPQHSRLALIVLTNGCRSLPSDLPHTD